MTEYFRDSNNRIQAGFALHTGKLLLQYRGVTANLPPNKKYEATLAICVAQALLTNCSELIKAMRSHQRGFWDDKVTDIPGHWGIRHSFIQSNTFPGEVTHSQFVDHVRNALSHPTSPDRLPRYPTTGYTTVTDGSEVISRFCFFDSPWVDRGVIRSSWLSPQQDKVEESLRKFQRTWPDKSLSVRKIGGKFQVCRGGEEFLPVFVANLSLNELTEFGITFANHLSQPTLANWDGVTIERLVA